MGIRQGWGDHAQQKEENVGSVTLEFGVCYSAVSASHLQHMSTDYYYKHFIIKLSRFVEYLLCARFGKKGCTCNLSLSSPDNSSKRLASCPVYKTEAEGCSNLAHDISLLRGGSVIWSLSCSAASLC